MATLLGPSIICTITSPTPGTQVKVGQTYKVSIQVAGSIAVQSVLGVVHNVKDPAPLVIFDHSGANVVERDWVPTAPGAYNVQAAAWPADGTPQSQVPGFVVYAVA